MTKRVNYIAIDLGSANTRIYLSDQGLALDEPSVVAVQKKDKYGQILAVGREAIGLVSGASSALKTVWPMKHSVKANFPLILEMLELFVDQSVFSCDIQRCVLMAMPLFLTKAQKKITLETVVTQTGALLGYFIDPNMAAALGAGLPVTTPTANLIVDLGARTTKVSVISRNKVVYAKSCPEGGFKIDEAISLLVREKYHLLINDRQAEDIKRRIGAASPSLQVDYLEVQGQDLFSGQPETVNLDSEEVFTIIDERLKSIIALVHSAIERVPPQLTADLAARGLVLIGGGALLRRLDFLLSVETSLPVRFADEPLTAVVKGCFLSK
ncbi:MAG: rod shape-determining protein [Deltaproteobacteria bacterium]|jgi:rod shape-determining protein MreB|nr:rod shape-determining protein [Deltaproteobacteria bacterium]